MDPHWRRIRILLAVLCILVPAAAEAFPGYGLFTPKPHRTATVQKASLRVDDMKRSFLFYVPKNLPSNAPLIIVLHGATQTAKQMRVSTGYEFERLADQHGFAVVYPNGYRRHWNDCRAEASYSARRRNIDDKAFVHTLIGHFHSTAGIDRSRVFATGYSNGGHMAYRLAFELPGEIAGIAAVAATIPTDDNCACEKSTVGIPVMIINGTSDPISPHKGGKVTLFGVGSRGRVISSRQSAEYFVRVNQQNGEPEISRREDPRRFRRTSVERLDWREPGKPEVALIVINRGGHVFPQPRYRAPWFLGRTSRLVNAPEEIWHFFTRQRPNAPTSQNP